jgi:hypothetical protein
VDFLHFQSSKICVNPTGVVSSFFPLRCCLPSCRCHHTTTPCYACFPWSQDELAASVSFSDNASSCHLPFLNRNWSIKFVPPPLATLPEQSDSHPPLLSKCHLNLSHSLHNSTMSLFYMFSNQSTTLSEFHPSSSFHFTVVPWPSSLCQRHLWRRTSRPAFDLQATYWHVNSHKNIKLVINYL